MAQPIRPGAPRDPNSAQVSGYQFVVDIEGGIPALLPLMAKADELGLEVELKDNTLTVSIYNFSHQWGALKALERMTEYLSLKP